jgi:hypothetical protein
MNSAPGNRELVRVVQATPAEVAACVEALGRAGKRGERWAGEKLVGLYFVVAREPAQGLEAAPRFLFGKVGNQWKVIFEGGTAFYLSDTLGARYLDYLLHRANVPISAFHLEVEIQPEKGEARSTTSIQGGIDGRARRDYERALRKLRAERAEAREASDEGEANRLDGLIEPLESALKTGKTGDTGERARGNVTQALAAVRRRLGRGNRWERAFAEHLSQFLSLGYQCMYTQAEGEMWK